MFDPKFIISTRLAKKLIELERLAIGLEHVKLTPTVLAGLKETARIQTVHFSTRIEGNRLTLAEVQTVLAEESLNVGRERDEAEVRGYFTALNQVLEWVENKKPLSDARLKHLHALVMAEGRFTSARTPYRQVQNLIRDSRTGSITYMPPEAKDVPSLMSELFDWLNSDEAQDLPAPLVAGLLHYQFVTIHPYLDGNGRTARLLTTWQLHLSGYGLGGIYALEEHYAQNLLAYYASLALGPSHNYYFGRVETDLTPWLEYFVDGMFKSLKAVSIAVEGQNAGEKEVVPQAVYLDYRKRQLLTNLGERRLLKSRDLAGLFGIGDRAARNLAQKWVSEGFLEIEDPSKRARLYRISLKTM